jgi:hypothetical protein
MNVGYFQASLHLIEMELRIGITTQMNTNAFKIIGNHEQEKPIIAMNQAAYIFPGDTPAFFPVQEGKNLQQGVVILDTTLHMI